MPQLTCSVCGKPLQNLKTGLDEIGFLLRVNPSSNEYHDFTKMFGSTELSMCYCCLAKNLGFKKVRVNLTQDEYIARYVTAVKQELTMEYTDLIKFAIADWVLYGNTVSPEQRARILIQTLNR